MKCSICNLEYEKNLDLIRHIKKVHNITRNEYYDKYIKKTNEGTCIVCGKRTTLKNYSDGYRKYCCVICKQKNWHVTFTKTCKERYGVENPFQSDIVKEKIGETNMKRYGEKFPNRFSGQKFNNMMIEKYGDDWVCDMSKRGLEAFKKKYGVENPSKLMSVVDKSKKTKFENLYKDVIKNADIIKYDYNTRNFTYKCNKCGNVEIKAGLYKTRLDNNAIICPCCNPIAVSNYETDQKNLYETIKQYYFNEIKYNDRKTLKHHHELDIFIPDKNVAIEYNGLYWHNELFKDADYHLRKTEECEERGIQLIHIFEDEWNNKSNIVISRIKSILNLNEKIYARKTVCQEITDNDSKIFLEQNHLQGSCQSAIRYGLFYDNELVSVMTFGKSRFKKNEFELLRFANKLNINVIGGAAKLFKHFLNDHPEIVKIISYADRRWSKGNLYEKLGFKFIEKTPINYYYVLNDGLHNRLEFQKHKLVASGYDANKTEHQIMLDRKIYRIYDCGNLKFEFTRGQNCI